MSATEWFAVGVVCWCVAIIVILDILSINKHSEAEDAEQRRAVSRPAELDEQLRKDGWI